MPLQFKWILQHFSTHGALFVIAESWVQNILSQLLHKQQMVTEVNGQGNLILTCCAFKLFLHATAVQMDFVTF